LDLSLSLFGLRVTFLFFSGLWFLLPQVITDKEVYGAFSRVYSRVSLSFLIALLGAVLAILGLIFPINGGILFGDLLPNLLIILAATFFFFQYIRAVDGLEEEARQKATEVLDSLQMPLGLVCWITAILHLIIPGWAIV
jgi:hypothetical protein